MKRNKKPARGATVEQTMAKRRSSFHTSNPTSRSPDNYREAERWLKAGTHLSGDQLAFLLECHPKEPVPDAVRNYLIGFLRDKATLPPGRKAKNGARWDFTIADVIDLYKQKLSAIRNEDKARRAQARATGEILPRAEDPPHERAAAFVLEKMKANLGNISAKRLINIISDSKWREVPEEDEIPPDEHDPPDHLPDPD